MKKNNAIINGIIIGILLLSGASTTNISAINITTMKLQGSLLGVDCLIPPDITDRLTDLRTDPSPGLHETSEYMIGSVAVSVIFMESDGSIDPSSEDWTTDEEIQVRNIRSSSKLPATSCPYYDI